MSGQTYFLSTPAMPRIAGPGFCASGVLMRAAQALLMGGQTYFLSTPSISTLFEDLQAVRPTEIVLPPRICSLLYERFHEELDALTQQQASNGSADAAAELREV